MNESIIIMNTLPSPTPSFPPSGNLRAIMSWRTFFLAGKEDATILVIIEGLQPDGHTENSKNRNINRKNTT